MMLELNNFDMIKLQKIIRMQFLCTNILCFESPKIGIDNN